MRRTRVAIGALTVVVLAGAWLLWRSNETARQASAGDPTSPAGTPPRLPQREFDETSSSEEASADPPPEAPPVVAATEPDRSPAKDCALAFGDAPNCDFLDPDQDTLLEMARCGIARLDTPLLPTPGSGSGVFPNDWLEKAKVSEAEHQRLEQAAAAFMSKQQQRFAELATTVGIERAWAETSAPTVVVNRIAAEFEDDALGAAVERVARERAGLSPNDVEVPATLDAAVRLRLDTGDAFEAAIAEAVGEARAAELRAVADGWPGAHTFLGNSCEADAVPPPERRLVPRTKTEAEACVEDPKGQGCGFLDPNQLELDRMADCGVIRFNLPVFVHDRSAEPTFGDEWANAVNLTPQEAAMLAEVAEEFREALYGELTKLAIEAGKTPEWAAETPFLGMVMAIGEASPLSPQDAEAMLRRLAAEQAGRVAPPADLSSLSLDERFTRITIELGDEFEKALAERLGPDRASELQHAKDGWPGPRVQGENLCDGSQHQLL